MGFGQAVIGPPGSGKTTYCWGLQQYFKAISRPMLLINLDPAVEELPYQASIDIRDLINLNEVMAYNALGPNGSILFCLEYLDKNFDWFSDKLNELTRRQPSSFPPSSSTAGSSSSNLNDQQDEIDPHLELIDYIVLDLPGQVELSTDHESLRKILHKLEKLDWRLAAVQLTDSTHIIDPIKYISIVLLNLKTMLHLGLPQVNVLTKIDLLKNFNQEFKLNLDFYTDVQDLSYLLPMLEDQISPKFTKLNKAIIELIEDFNLVGFETLCVEDKSSMTKLILTIDKALGYYPSHQRYPRISKPSTSCTGERAEEEEGGTTKGEGAACSTRTEGQPEDLQFSSNSSTSMMCEIQERWVDYPDLYDQFERELWAHEADLVAQNASKLNQLRAVQKSK